MNKSINKKSKLELYSLNEMIDILKNKDRLVYIDDGIAEVVGKYDDLPDIIVDLVENYDVVALTVYNFYGCSTTPILTTNGFYLDKCDPDVRLDIIDRLVKLQTGQEEIKDYKLIDEYMLDDYKYYEERNM